MNNGGNKEEAKSPARLYLSNAFNDDGARNSPTMHMSQNKIDPMSGLKQSQKRGPRKLIESLRQPALDVSEIQEEAGAFHQTPPPLLDTALKNTNNITLTKQHLLNAEENNFPLVNANEIKITMLSKHPTLDYLLGGDAG